MSILGDLLGYGKEDMPLELEEILDQYGNTRARAAAKRALRAEEENQSAEALFRKWLKLHVKENGMRWYSDNEIGSYCYALHYVAVRVYGSEEGNLFLSTTADSVSEKVEGIREKPEYESINEESNGTLDVALRMYQAWIYNSGELMSAELHAPFYLPEGGKKVETKEEVLEQFYYEEVPMDYVQKVYYGAPGTGKSYQVELFLQSQYPDPEERDQHCKRVIFHPTYSYGEFVGQIKPMISVDKPLDYAYVAGPFTVLLKYAFLNPEEKYYLVIEEINRGNAPAIFGDLFQLLDRGKDGRSEYPLINRDIGAYFSLDPWMKNVFHSGKIWLPANFNIIATMNTADENIFVMDSAFKRRFALEYVPVDFTEVPDWVKEEYATFAGEEPLEKVLGLEEASKGRFAQVARELQKQGKLQRNWPAFGMLVNAAIDEENLKARMAGKPKEERIAENKKLGPFFPRRDELEDRAKFINKVIFYLKQDVFANSTSRMLLSFEELTEDYLEQGKDLFTLLVPEGPEKR